MQAPQGDIRTSRPHRYGTAVNAGSGTTPRWLAGLGGRGGIALAGAWGFAEGTLLFIVPDVVLSLAAMYLGRRALRHVVAAVAGALLAGGVVVAWASVDHPAASAAVGKVPFVRERMFAQANEELAEQGALALLRGAFTGVPYKVFAVAAPGSMPVTTFLAATAPARAARFLLVWAVFAMLGSRMRKRQPVPWRRLLVMHAALWVPFYLVYWRVV